MDYSIFLLTGQVEGHREMVPSLSLFFLALLLSVDCSLPSYQKDSLVALYDATGGPNWYNKWNISTSLSLAGNNLTGTLTDLQLPSLTTL